MRLSLPHERLFGDRRGLLGQLDRLRREADARGEAAAIDQFQEQAFRLLLDGGVERALDLSREDPATIARYDTSSRRTPGRWNSVARGREGLYDADAATLGKSLLLARRLCEAGCGFVTVHAGYAGTWDMHADGNNLNMRDGMEAIGPAFDHAVAALVEDLEARGLADRILLVATGEMGRTPRLNRGGGRDHWGKLAPLLLYGGGLTGGQVIGASTRDGGEPLDHAVGPERLLATVLGTLLDVGRLRLLSGVPEELQRLVAEPPIPGTV
jgi:hypothetical protein